MQSDDKTDMTVLIFYKTVNSVVRSRFFLKHRTFSKVPFLSLSDLRKVIHALVSFRLDHTYIYGLAFVRIPFPFFLKPVQITVAQDNIITPQY